MRTKEELPKAITNWTDLQLKGKLDFPGQAELRVALGELGVIRAKTSYLPFGKNGLSADKLK